MCLFNLMYKKEDVPDEWRHGIIVTLPKNTWENTWKIHSHFQGIDTSVIVTASEVSHYSLFLAKYFLACCYTG